MTAQHPTPAERDERVTMPLDPEAALRALLAVRPDVPQTTDGAQPRPPVAARENHSNSEA